MKFNFYADPSHGWLKVPMSLLRELGIANQITPYSYRRGNDAYLEEDCDVATFIKVMAGVGRKVEFREFVARFKSSKIRNYTSYFA